uniref:(California timema) hypothetical protein n=2 Tax=Timema TaxID=61471 RepID=A0A7R9JF44_TIMCA|nr:unnamed protein product [Timema californicum]
MWRQDSSPVDCVLSPRSVQSGEGQRGPLNSLTISHVSSDNTARPVGPDTPSVIKVEPHQNGPLFVEMNFYVRSAKPSLIEEWKQQKGLTHLGLSPYHGSGSHVYHGERYRFIVIERFGPDLNKLFLQSNRRFHLKTVLYLGIQIVSCYVQHTDSELLRTVDSPTSNIPVTGLHCATSSLLLGGRDRTLLVTVVLTLLLVTVVLTLLLLTLLLLTLLLVTVQWLLPSVLPAQHQTNRATSVRHAGKAMMCSKTSVPSPSTTCSTPSPSSLCVHLCFLYPSSHSRRGDLETLGYNLLQWLCGRLPWEDAETIVDPEYVHLQKKTFMNNIPQLMRRCFPHSESPAVMEQYLKYVNSLGFETRPDYSHCRKLLRQGIKDSHFVDDGKLVFGANPKVPLTKKRPVKRKSAEEPENICEVKPRKMSRSVLRQPCVAHNFNRDPTSIRRYWPNTRGQQVSEGTGQTRVANKYRKVLAKHAWPTSIGRYWPNTRGQQVSEGTGQTRVANKYRKVLAKHAWPTSIGRYWPNTRGQQVSEGTGQTRVANKYRKVLAKHAWPTSIGRYWPNTRGQQVSEGTGQTRVANKYRKVLAKHAWPTSIGRYWPNTRGQQVSEGTGQTRVANKYRKVLAKHAWPTSIGRYWPNTRGQQVSEGTGQTRVANKYRKVLAKHAWPTSIGRYWPNTRGQQVSEGTGQTRVANKYRKVLAKHAWPTSIGRYWPNTRGQQVSEGTGQTRVANKYRKVLAKHAWPTSIGRYWPNTRGQQVSEGTGQTRVANKYRKVLAKHAWPTSIGRYWPNTRGQQVSEGTCQTHVANKYRKVLAKPTWPTSIGRYWPNTRGQQVSEGTGQTRVVNKYRKVLAKHAWPTSIGRYWPTHVVNKYRKQFDWAKVLSSNPEKILFPEKKKAPLTTANLGSRVAHKIRRRLLSAVEDKEGDDPALVEGPYPREEDVLRNPTPAMQEVMSRLRQKNAPTPTWVQKHKADSRCTSPVERPRPLGRSRYRLPLTPAMEGVIKRRELLEEQSVRTTRSVSAARRKSVTLTGKTMAIVSSGAKKRSVPRSSQVRKKTPSLTCARVLRNSTAPRG